ncbi:iron complex transport system permease protein [Microbacteriaceae bacterium SG_E_30_P1]|uniref:Iron complex transport system permease protein n=1 Tax=Antiquaquibacter oligotrophicus TaxID=2880260 RepID=A0ABT6KR15_9MICO|nr:iron ABC transporter permease [Antiquaquibacter oligotrophicus]MDH6182261.1 iron complex transport system permease protein [Antiquaquibacter oligotrophicus]UDF12082.1 iron ABC transporter permease [Antiquaquibacter oligotrophicus]
MTTATITPGSPAHTLQRTRLVRLGWLAVALGVLAVLCVASLAFGARDVSWDEIVGGLSGSTSGIGESAVVKRVPRTVLAIIVGAALALAGASIQAVTRNPLADPGILGVSSGAALAVVIGIAFAGLSEPYTMVAVAILGAAVASAGVYTVGSLGRGGATPLKLTLAGAATSAALSSLVTAILLPRVDVLTLYQFWQIGGVGGADWGRIGVVAPILALGAVLCLISSRGMTVLALGDDLAAGLGERVGRTRLVGAIGAILLCGTATAVAGPIGFVGLVVPHVCRLIVGTDYRWLLPFSAIGGAALLVAADVLGRVIARPEEIQVGIITAVIGAPFFIWIVRRQRVREL